MTAALIASPLAAQTGSLLDQLKDQHILCGTTSFGFPAGGKIEILDMLDDDVDFQIPESQATADANKVELKVVGVGAPFVITKEGDKLVHNQMTCEKKH
ncbi:MAG: hypothetical protein U1E56_02970 [Bauldia sp.]